tara:strand:+ start:310 stop:738 length:429 start_codon:yes stop_codon:yes gene_type:complete
MFFAFLFFIQVNSLNLWKIEFSNMKTQAANDKLDAILAKVEKKGVDAPKLIETLKELRVVALQEQDPLVVKTLRLTYEFLDEKKSFNVQAQYEEDDEGNEYPLEIEDKENLVYLLTLLKDAEHKINREEIKDYRTVLKEQLY